LDSKELNALIKLLDDPDEEIFFHVKEKILSLGPEVVPVLENIWESGDPFNSIVQTRIENIIHKIQFIKVKEELNTWSKSENNSLLEGALIVAKYQYPDLDKNKVEKKIEQMIQDVWLELNNGLTALEKIKVINHIIFDIHSYGGNTSNFHSPQNSFINHVIETKKGNPLSLSVIYITIAQKLGIPVYGVNLPQHFVMAYIDDFSELAKKNNINIESLLKDANFSSVLFYVNPFSRGSVFPKNDIDVFLKQLKLSPKRHYYEPCKNNVIIARMINNLIFAFEKSGYQNKKEELIELKTSIENILPEEDNPLDLNNERPS